MLDEDKFSNTTFKDVLYGMYEIRVRDEFFGRKMIKSEMSTIYKIHSVIRFIKSIIANYFYKSINRKNK